MLRRDLELLGFNSDVAAYVYAFVLMYRAPCLRVSGLKKTITTNQSRYMTAIHNIPDGLRPLFASWTDVRMHPHRETDILTWHARQPIFYCGDLVFYRGERMRVVRLYGYKPAMYRLRKHRKHTCRHRACRVFYGFDNEAEAFPHERCVCGKRLPYVVPETELRLVQRSGLRCSLRYHMNRFTR